MIKMGSEHEIFAVDIIREDSYGSLCVQNCAIQQNCHYLKLFWSLGLGFMVHDSYYDEVVL